MSTKVKAHRPAAPPKTYRELCAVLLPRKIHDDLELDAVQEIIDTLAPLPSRTKDQADYLETLAELVEAYEDQNVKISKRTGLEALKFLLDENGLTASDLSRILGTDISLGYRVGPEVFL
jgi:antitoxin component HigA of HigAB toxin-antitoxin module